MIRAGQVGRRAPWNLGEFAELWDVPDDTEWDEKGRTMISYIRSIQFGYYGNEAPVLYQPSKVVWFSLKECSFNGACNVLASSISLILSNKEPICLKCIFFVGLEYE